MPRTVKNDITGKRFGRLVAVKFVPDDSEFSKFECVCDCGKTVIVMAQSLNRGATVSCGCYGSDKRRAEKTIHGEAGNKTRSRAYSSWANMMMRCEWGGHPSYAKYGAKGIRVCERWHSFEKFKADMGERPKGTSIDRIDNNKGYEPGNCRWATRLEQALNTSRTIVVLYKGRKIPAFTLCDDLGISKKALRARAFRRGNDYVEAFKSIGIDVCRAR